MNDDQDRIRIRVGFRIDPQLDAEFNALAKSLHMSINEAHEEATKQFLYTKGTKVIKRNIEIERKKLDALEQYLVQFEESQYIPPEQLKQSISKELKREIDSYVMKIDRFHTSRHVIEFASAISNKNNLVLKDTLNLLRECVFDHFPEADVSNRRLVIIENAINETEGV